MTVRTLALALTLAALATGCARERTPAARAARPDRAEAPALSVTGVGAGGYLLRGAGRAVLVDGFPGRAAARDSVLRRSLAERVAGRPPFDSVSVALVGRATPESFDPALAGRFLESHPRTLLAATPLVRAEIAARFPRAAAVRAQVVPVAWDARGRTSHALNGVVVDFFRVRPAGAARHGEDVVVQVVHLGRSAVLDATDPALQPRQLAALRLGREGLDLGVFSYALLVAPGADTLVTRRLHPKRVAVTRLPEGRDAALARVRERFPGAEALGELPPPRAR